MAAMTPFLLVIAAASASTTFSVADDGAKEEKDHREEVAKFAEMDAKVDGTDFAKTEKKRVADLITELRKAESVDLLRLDESFPTRHKFHKRPVSCVDSIQTAEERKVVVGFVAASIHWNRGCMGLCFSPGYGVQIQVGKRSFELVFCFHCNRVEVYEDGTAAGSFALRPVRAKDLLLETRLAAAEKARVERWDESDKLNADFERDFATKQPERAALNKQVIAGLVGRLAEAKEVRVFALKPDRLDPDEVKGVKTFRNYEVIAEKTITAADARKGIVGLMESKLHRHDVLKGLCFKPRHGLRFVLEKSEIEMVVCFECWQVYCYEGEKSLGDFGLGTVRPSENLLEKLLFEQVANAQAKPPGSGVWGSWTEKKVQ